MGTPKERWQYSAAVFNVSAGQFIGRALAAEVQENKNHHYYCLDCLKLEEPAFTRLKRGTALVNDIGTFDLYRKDHATHKCDHFARYRALYAEDIRGVPMAQRYGGVQTNGRHDYTFPISMQNIKVDPVWSINSVARLERIIDAVMFDEEWRSKLRFDNGYEHLTITELFEANKNDITQPQAILFHPYKLACDRLARNNQGYIMGADNAVLQCESPDLFKDVYKMTCRHGGNTSAPVLAYARSKMFHHEKLGLKRHFIIESMDQIKTRDAPLDFKKAITNQVKTPFPKNSAEADMILFKQAALQPVFA